MTYFPEHNFSGLIHLVSKLQTKRFFDENGEFIGGPRSVVIPISIEVTMLMTSLYLHLLLLESNSSSSVVWNDEVVDMKLL